MNYKALKKIIKGELDDNAEGRNFSNDLILKSAAMEV
jgi:hypothetical protein